MVKVNQKNHGFGAVGILLAVAVAAAIGFAGWYVFIKADKASAPSPSSQPQAPSSNQEVEFETPKKGAHFETSTPAHADTLPAPPAGVVIDFNFDLADNSTIRIVKDGKDYGQGGVTIDSNKLAMRRAMDASAPNGVYTVEYKGCWPDGSCHDGHFQFAIDTRLQDAYNDQRNKKEVSIKMSQIKFQPMNLLISKGTKVTWVNDDSEVHYVNTDSHPAHTHTPGLNSKALSMGQQYSFTFAAAGSYPYHCSAHAAAMTGTIVVI